MSFHQPDRAVTSACSLGVPTSYMKKLRFLRSGYIEATHFP